MNDIIAVVPARGGSKGIKRKNLKILGTEPLINYTLMTLMRIKKINRIIVSTEDEEIKNHCKKINKKIEVLDRPKELADDKTPLTSVVHHVSQQLKQNNEHHNFILQVAATCPFVKVKTYNKIIKILTTKKSNCAVTLKQIEHEHPYRAKVLKKNGTFHQLIKNINVEKFISRQDLPKFFCTSGAIYGRSYNLLKKFTHKDFCLGNKPYGVIVDDIEAVNIDRPIDFDFAKFIVENKINK
tara:strand:- start:688 stop:1407 length:720 start_codon:yes stop_codon:yes gene_type:complete